MVNNPSSLVTVCAGDMGADAVGVGEALAAGVGSALTTNEEVAAAL